MNFIVENVIFKKQPEAITSGCLIGVLLRAFQCINTYAASVIGGTILYSVYNCGVSLMSAATGKVFNEELSVKQYAGIFVGVIAVVSLCL